MLVALLLCTLLLAGCQTAGGGEVKAGGPGHGNKSQLDIPNETILENTRDAEEVASAMEPQQAAAPDTGLAIDALRRALADGGQAAATALGLIARLPTEGAQPFAAQVDMNPDSLAEPTSQRLAAWLAAKPAAAKSYLETGLAAGRAECFMALAHNPGLGRPLLSNLQLGPGDIRQGSLVLDLLRLWGGAVPGDGGLLGRLVVSEDPDVAYRAAGYLLATGSGGDPERMLLETAVQERGEGWVGAVEGIRISGDPELADALVPLVAGAQMLEERGGEGRAETAAEDNVVVLGSYALSYLPGEQASLMRHKLLGAASPAVRWQAMLGELLHGNPYPWHHAVADLGIERPEMWVVLEPPEAVHPELLPLYAACSYAVDAGIRGRAARQMNRYNGIASDSRAARILGRLVTDEDPDVSVQAWMSAGKLRLPGIAAEAAARLESTDSGGPERLAQAYCVLANGPAAAGSGPEEKGSDG